jgi:hypothetical protein
MKSIAVLALIGNISAHKLSMNMNTRILSNLRFDESEGPTKADLGDGDYEVVTREADLSNLNNKESGWVNPLSITDDGTDDD